MTNGKMTRFEDLKDFIIGYDFQCELAQIADKYNMTHSSLKAAVEDIFNNWDVRREFDSEFKCLL
jgi:hypothetical protein